MDLPIQDENWTQNLRDYVEYRVEVNANNERCGIFEWFYDTEKTRKRAELIFNIRLISIRFRSWYENGELKTEYNNKNG